MRFLITAGLTKIVRRYEEFFPAATKNTHISTKIDQFVFSRNLLIKTAYNGRFQW